MVKIIYSGDISPCSIKVYNNIYMWKDGEIKDLDEFHAKKLVADNNHFKYVGKETSTAVKSPEPTKKIEIVEHKETVEIDKMSKDELLDYTAQKNIKADYTMTKEELKNKIRN